MKLSVVSARKTQVNFPNSSIRSQSFSSAAKGASRCGIVGAGAQRNVVPSLVEGLRRLEYRGYDSCGVAVHVDGELKRLRRVARVAEVNHQAESLSSFVGLADTRWAKHGAPTTANAHPHVSAGPGVPKAGVTRRARIAIVHNGIIENYE